MSNARAFSGRDEPVYAALDLGTNNCRLLVARANDNGFEVIDSFSRIVRLGEGLHATGRLSEKAIDRTVTALGICADKMRRRHANRLRCVATEACREASNCSSFVERVGRETGVKLEIIDTREEARLAVRGCGPLLERSRPYALMFDIGGGSSEIMWLRVPEHGSPELIDSISVPWGVVTLADRFGGEVVTRATYEAMIGEVAAYAAEFEAKWRIRDKIAAGDVQMLGTSGTVTTVTGIHLDLPRYQRDEVDGRSITFDEIDAVTCRLRAMAYSERAAHPCVGPERADLVLAGCAVLDAICQTWPVGGLRVADRGVREGILFGLIWQDQERAVSEALGGE